MRVDLTPPRARPLCLLDVDGVVVVLGAGSGEPLFEATVAGFPVTVAVAARERLSGLAEAFQIVWASSWMRDGAEALGPLVGLADDVPFLRFDPDADRDAVTYKLPVVQRFVRDRAVAWVDDELGGEVVIGWAESREHPTLLVHTDPRVGLVDEHVATLLAFAARCGRAADG
jgi:hypothetical protein